MAGARDLARFTAKIRKAQKERNKEAVREAEERRREAERQAEMTPAELRRELAAKRQEERLHIREAGTRRRTPLERLIDAAKDAAEDVVESIKEELTEEAGEFLDEVDDVVGDVLEDVKQSLPHEDKMEREIEDKFISYKVEFISDRAQQLAQKFGLTDYDLRRFTPKNDRGFSAAEIREIHKEVNDA